MRALAFAWFLKRKKTHSHLHNTLMLVSVCALFALDKEYRRIHKTVDFDSAIARAHSPNIQTFILLLLLLLLFLLLFSSPLSHIIIFECSFKCAKCVYECKRDGKREWNFSYCLFDVTFSVVDSVLNAVVCHALDNKFAVSLNTIQPQTNDNDEVKWI